MSKELHKTQQKRIDDIANKYLDYMDMFYDDKEPKKKRRKPSQDISLDIPKKPKKPDYGTGICIHPGCLAKFKKNSGVQLRCPAHRHRYIPVAKREKENGNKS